MNVTKRLNGRINIEKGRSNVQMENLSCDFHVISGCLRSTFKELAIELLFKQIFEGN